MQFLFRDTPAQNYSQWAYYLEAFSKEECEKIKALFINPSEAVIDNGTKNTDVRKSNVSWLGNNQDTQWIFERLAPYILQANKDRYGFDLSGFGEAIQIGCYNEGDFYKWHQDSGPHEFSNRKLSIVVQLSNPEDYEGGELQFLGFENEKVVSGQGDLILFPSYNPHQVTKITKGQRYSLVAWISGPCFR